MYVRDTDLCYKAPKTNNGRPRATFPCPVVERRSSVAYDNNKIIRRSTTPRSFRSVKNTTRRGEHVRCTGNEHVSRVYRASRRGSPEPCSRHRSPRSSSRIRTQGDVAFSRRRCSAHNSHYKLYVSRSSNRPRIARFVSFVVPLHFSDFF